MRETASAAEQTLLMNSALRISSMSPWQRHADNYLRTSGLLRRRAVPPFPLLLARNIVWLLPPPDQAVLRADPQARPLPEAQRLRAQRSQPHPSETLRCHRLAPIPMQAAAL